MIIQIDVSNSFDGTTEAPAPLLTDLGGEVYSLTDAAGDPFVDLGLIPWSAFQIELGSALGAVTYAGHDAAAGVTGAELALQAGGVSIYARTWNPQTPPGYAPGFEVMTPGSKLLIKTNAVGAQRMVLELIALNVDNAALIAARELQGRAIAQPFTLIVAAIVTAAATAAAGSIQPYDTSGGAFALSLPANPSANDRVCLKEAANSAVNALTIDGNGKNVEEAAGAFAATTTYNVANGWVRYIFDATGDVWRLVNLR